MNAISSGPSRSGVAPDCSILAYCRRLPYRSCKAFTAGVNTNDAKLCAMPTPLLSGALSHEISALSLFPEQPAGVVPLGAYKCADSPHWAPFPVDNSFKGIANQHAGSAKTNNATEREHDNGARADHDSVPG